MRTTMNMGFAIVRAPQFPTRGFTSRVLVIEK